VMERGDHARIISEGFCSTDSAVPCALYTRLAYSFRIVLHVAFDTLSLQISRMNFLLVGLLDSI
jgi:hypothetical protein